MLHVLQGLQVLQVLQVSQGDGVPHVSQEDGGGGGAQGVLQGAGAGHGL